MQTVTISGSPRENVGTKHSKIDRREGKVPCVIYGGEQPIHFTAEPSVFRPLIYSPEFQLAEISVAGKNYRCILKDTQFHPVTDDLMHVDLLQLVAGQPVKVQIPVKFKGVSPGVKSGGKLIRNIRRVKVKTTPENLVDHMVLDISSLELGQSIRVRDLIPVEGVSVMEPAASPIAVVEVPRALKSAATAAAKEAKGGAAKKK